MSGSDDHSQENETSQGPVFRTPENEDEVHSSAELDFEQLTTSTIDFPAIKIELPSSPAEPAPPAPQAETPHSEVSQAEPDSEIEVPVAMDEAPSIFDKADSVATPMERVTFSNLEALVPPTPAKTVEKEPAPAARPIQRQTTIHEVRPPSFARFFVAAIILLVIGLATIFGYRIGWDMELLKTEPGIAFKVALGVQEKPRPVEAQPPVEAPVKADSLRGELNAVDVTLERLSQGPHKGQLIIKGRLQNNTNRMQTMVMLRSSLISADGLPLESRKHRCCQLLDADGREAAPQAPTSLKPGDVKYFSVRFSRKHSRNKTVRPRVEVLFSEAERLP